jgi:hypothetical protein
MPFLIYKVKPLGLVAELGWKGWRMKSLTRYGVSDRPLFLPPWP